MYNETCPDMMNDAVLCCATLHCTESTGKCREGRLGREAMASCVSVPLVPAMILHCTWPRTHPEPADVTGQRFSVDSYDSSL